MSSERKREPIRAPINAKKEHAREVYAVLSELHSDAHIELNYTTPLELLVATILSAQCTDRRVNEITAVLFKKFTGAADYAKRSASELEEIIKSAGFFRQKAKSIQGAAKRILEHHGGEVPRTMEELVKLPGVGRKTANVVLGNAFGIPGMPVDTHVLRLTHRLGLTKSSDPVQVEHEMTALLPEKDWTQFSHVLIFHGRRVCKARNPACDQCPASSLCPYFQLVRSEDKGKTRGKQKSARPH